MVRLTIHCVAEKDVPAKAPDAPRVVYWAVSLTNTRAARFRVPLWHDIVSLHKDDT